MATGNGNSCTSAAPVQERTALPFQDLNSFKKIPVHVVTSSTQLPSSFLHPSPSNPIAIGFDCEGVDLCRTGRLCIMQLAFDDAIYLVDLISGEEDLMQSCKIGLESKFVTKIVHDCKRDGEALYFQFGVKLNPVFDTQIAYAMIEEKNGVKFYSHDLISFVQLLADDTYCGITYDEKQEVRDIMQKDKEFWMHRPWTEMMTRVAADDVRFLLSIHHRMQSMLTQRQLALLSLRSGLHCRCFCIDASDWPQPYPSLSDLDKINNDIDKMNKDKTMNTDNINDIYNMKNLNLSDEYQYGNGKDAVHSTINRIENEKKDNEDKNEEKNAEEGVQTDKIAEKDKMEEEILFTIDIPHGVMGRIIGKKGSTIKAIRMESKADIITGGMKGPPNKIFLIGEKKEVQKTAAIIRGKIYSHKFR